MDIEELLTTTTLEELDENVILSHLPDDPDQLKQISDMLYQRFHEISTTNNDIIKNLQNQNNELKQLAKDYYAKFKSLKQENESIITQIQNTKQEVSNLTEAATEKKKKLQHDISSIQTEQKYFKHELGISKDNSSNNNTDNNTKNNNNLNENQISNNTQQENEMDALMFLLKKAFEEGYDLFTGSGLTMDEKMQLRSLLKLEMCADLGENEEEDEDNLSDNLDIGNQIVSLIELDVNELFLNKMINNVKIDQINAFNYSFEDFRVSKDVKLKIENNVLYTENDVKFTDWLLEFFGTKNKN